MDQKSIADIADTQKISGARMFFLIVTCALVMLLEGFDIQAMGIVAPILMPLLHLDPIQAGQIFAGGQVGVVLGALAGGALSDTWGRRNILVLAVLLFGAFSFATIFAFDFNSLMAARVMTGIGLGAAMPNVIGLAVDTASAKNRVKIVTAIMAGMPLGGTLVALFAALYLKQTGWEMLFYIGGLVPLCLTLLIVTLPNTRMKKDALPADKVNAYAALFGGGRALSTLLLWLVFFLTSSVLYMILNWLPSLMTARGFDIEIAHQSSLVFNLVSIFGTLLMGAVIDSYGYKWALPVAYIGFLAGICGLAFTGTVEPLLISAGATGFFLLGAQYSLGGVSPMYYPLSVRGLGTGAALAFGRLGSITGPLAAGYVLKSGFGPVHSGPAGVAQVMIPLVVVAGLAVFALTRQAKILVDP